jgi:hypothetical protein
MVGAGTAQTPATTAGAVVTTDAGTAPTPATVAGTTVEPVVTVGAGTAQTPATTAGAVVTTDAGTDPTLATVAGVTTVMTAPAAAIIILRAIRLKTRPPPVLT